MQSGCELCGYNGLGFYKEFSESRDNASSISRLLVFFYSIELPSVDFWTLIPSLCATVAHLTVLCTFDMAKLVRGILDWQGW